ncbi:MAG: hypothetical protein AAGA56_12480 [Myxococcota bacterium]
MRTLVGALVFAAGCSLVAGLEPPSESVDTTGGQGGATSGAPTPTSGGQGGADELPSSCGDGVRNGNETDVDCGGDTCPPCSNGLACEVGSDCISGRCDVGCGPWSQVFGAEDTPTVADQANDVAAMANGDLVVVGTFVDANSVANVDTMLFGVRAECGRGANGFAARLSPIGETRWVSCIGSDEADEVYAVAAVGDDVVVAGRSEEVGAMVVRGPDLARDDCPADRGPAIWVARLDGQSGDGTWLTCGDAGDNSASHRPYDVAFDAARGAVIVAGELSVGFRFGTDSDDRMLNSPRGNTGTDGFVVKLDADTGDQLWARDFGSGAGEGEPLRGVAVDPAGRIYAVGQAWGSWELAARGELSPQGGSDGMLLALDPEGFPRWARRIGSRERDALRAVTTGPGGEVWTAGFIGDTVTLGAAGNTVGTNGDGDAFVARYGADGTARWGSAGGGASFDQATAVAVTESGQAIVAGEFRSSSVSLAAATLINADQSTAQNQRGDIFLFALREDNGGPLDAVSFNSPGSGDLPLGLGRSTSGNLLLVGRYDRTIDFGDGLHASERDSPDGFVASLGDLFAE